MALIDKDVAWFAARMMARRGSMAALHAGLRTAQFETEGQVARAGDWARVTAALGSLAPPRTPGARHGELITLAAYRDRRAEALTADRAAALPARSRSLR